MTLAFDKVDGWAWPYQHRISCTTVEVDDVLTIEGSLPFYSLSHEEFKYVPM